MTDTRVLSGRYRITRHLARGGMGDVFEAEDQLLGRRVAVKLLHAQFARDEAFVARFRREAQRAAGLNHPNIVSIYDWGEYEQNYYMVMELIDGRTLREIRRSEGALLPRRAAEIIAEVAAALTVAHEAGVTHRDIKPGNIMLTPDGSVKVTDFGIARALDDSEELTRTGAVIGTATYFSPEQAQGLPADARSDVYSLGVVLYELLAGRSPFQGESPVAVAYQHVSEWAPPVTSVNPNVPAALEAIVDRAMEKDPMGRYQTASEMRTDLLRFLRGEMPSAAAVIPVVAGADAATQLFTASSSPPPPPTATPDETARHVATLPEEPESRRSYVFGIIALLLLLAAGIFLLTRLLADSDDGPELIAVPSVANLTRDAAVDELQSLDFRVRIQDVASADIEQGFVIDTDPPAGTQVEIGSTVTLIVSLGPEQFPVPPVLGLTGDAARALIEEQGFVVGNVTTRFDNSVDAGLVLEQDPEAGEPAAPGTEVDLVVSDGPFAFTVPDVSGMSRDDATALLEEEGFEVEVEEEFDDEVAEDFVIRSEPGAGQLVDRENPVVTIFVSQGPEPFSVPDFIGDTVAEAQQRAAELGLELIISGDAVEVSPESGLDGLVAEQTPPAGTEVTAADPVRVRLGAVRQVTVPDLEGLTEDEARDELEDVGLELDVVGTVPVDFGSGLDGRVVGQDPGDGETVPVGTAVGVQIGEEEPPPETTTTTTTTTTPTTTPP